MRLSLLVLLGTLSLPLSSSKPLEPCPSACRCFLSEGLKRADCKHVPEWADQQSDAQDVRIVPPRPSAAGHPFALHLTHFEVFPKVLQLSVTNRSVVEIIPSGFHGLHSLQGLDLSHNLLSRFNYKVFLRMPALRRLVLQGNPIVLEPNARLLSSRSLLSLDLSYCSIASIPPGSLDGMPKLTTLSLRGNPIQMKGGEQLLHINTILELDLSACGLESVPSKALENLQNLRKLYLDGNKLLTIDKGVLPRGLHLLDLSSNQIRDVPTAVIYSLKNLTRLEMNENPIKCTCSLLGMQGWMSRQLVVSQNPVVCAEPAKFKGLPWTKVNELELCQDEESSSSSYSQSESSDESSESETEESDDSSQPQSIEMPPASYEVYTHENLIKHPQPALHLDHVLELKTLDFRSNNEINSIQGDQPYTHDMLGKEKDSAHEDEVSEETTSLDSSEDEEHPDEKHSGEQSRASFEESEDRDESVDQDTDRASWPDNDEATEKDAEVFMKNADTIAMGKSMPGEMQESEDDETESSNQNVETPTTHNMIENPVTIRQQEDTHFDKTEEKQTDNVSGTESLSDVEDHNPDSSTESIHVSNSNDDVSVTIHAENPTVATTTTSAEGTFLEKSHEDVEHATTIAPHETNNNESTQNESELENHQDITSPVTEADSLMINIHNKNEDQTQTKPEEAVVTQSLELENDDISSTTDGSVTKETGVLFSGGTEHADIENHENYSDSSENQAKEDSDIRPTESESSGFETTTEQPKSEVNVQGGDLVETTHTSLYSVEIAEPTVSSAPNLFTLPPIISDLEGKSAQEDTDRSEHGRKLDAPDDVDISAVTNSDSGRAEDQKPDQTTSTVDVPVIEEEIHPSIAKHVVETGDTESKESSVVDTESNKTDLDVTVPLFVPPLFEESAKSEQQPTDIPIDGSVPSGHDDSVDKEVLENEAQRTKHNDDMTADNTDAVPTDSEEKKSMLTYVVLGGIALAIIVLIVLALIRGKSEKKDGKIPVREDVGTEMKDMMNPLLEPNGDHPDQRRGLLGSLELIREAGEGKSSCGVVDSPEATSLLKPTLDNNEEEIVTESPKVIAANGNTADVVVEPSPIGVHKEPNGVPMTNGRAGKHNGIPTVPSKVKVKAGVIHTPVPRTPIVVNHTANGTRDQM